VGETVLILLQQRKYELQATEELRGSMLCSGQALPRDWENLLQPGSKLNMNALLNCISHSDSSQNACPKCLITLPTDQLEDQSGWLKWYAEFIDLSP